MKSMLRGVLFSIAFLSVQVCFAGTLSWLSSERWVTVQYVIDGDTFKTSKGEKIRLLGINTPETRHDSSPAQPFGHQAKKALQKLIAGKQVKLTFDKEKFDKYKRTLAHVYLKDGLWVNAELVRLGLAHVYTFVPNTKAAKALIQVEKQAIAVKRGMWRHKRWQVLDAKQLKESLLGQFRLVSGVVTGLDKKRWRFKLGKLIVTVPKKYRKTFRSGLGVENNQDLLVRGRLRMSKKRQWFLSIHSLGDVSHMN